MTHDVQIVREVVSGYVGPLPKWPERGDALAALDRLEARLALALEESEVILRQLRADQARLAEVERLRADAETRYTQACSERDRAAKGKTWHDPYEGCQVCRAEAAEARVKELERSEQVQAWVEVDNELRAAEARIAALEKGGPWVTWERFAEVERERDHYQFHFDQQEARAEAAEAREKALREELGFIIDATAGRAGISGIADIARAALARDEAGGGAA